jgi:hypothetical protein
MNAEKHYRGVSAIGDVKIIIEEVESGGFTAYYGIDLSNNNIIANSSSHIMLASHNREYKLIFGENKDVLLETCKKILCDEFGYIEWQK